MQYMPTTPDTNCKSEYLIIVDYHSRFFEEAKMPDTKSNTVITHIKSAFARHGTPCQVISDNDPQYSSKEFESFTKQWQFKHTIISPLYPQANGLVEKSVQTVKNLLTKAKQDNRDPYLGLLEHRNTPTDAVGSPAHFLKSRRLRSIISTSETQLQPRDLDANKVNEKLRLRQGVNGSSSCKERVSQANPVVEEPASASQEQGINHSGDGSMETSEQYKTRSGRVIRRTLRFKDCV